MKALNVVISVIVITFAGLVLTSQSNASTSNDSTAVTQNAKDELFSKFEKGLISGLSSDVTGVVESSIYNAINYKVAYPEFEPSRIEDKLYNVAIAAENHSVRYKAYLALTYYRNPGQFNAPDELLSLLDYQHKDAIFFYLQEKVNSDQLTSN